MSMMTDCLKKVYCKDCKYLHHNFFDYDIVYCEKNYEKKLRNDPIYGEKAYVKIEIPVKHPTVRNKNFDCEYFDLRFELKIKNKMNELVKKLTWIVRTW